LCKGRGNQSISIAVQWIAFSATDCFPKIDSHILKGIGTNVTFAHNKMQRSKAKQMGSVQRSSRSKSFMRAFRPTSIATFFVTCLLGTFSKLLYAQSESSNAFETYSSEILIGLLVTGLVLVLAVIFVLVERLLRLTEDQVRNEIKQQQQQEGTQEKQEH